MKNRSILGISLLCLLGLTAATAQAHTQAFNCLAENGKKQRPTYFVVINAEHNSAFILQKPGLPSLPWEIVYPNASVSRHDPSGVLTIRGVDQTSITWPTPDGTELASCYQVLKPTLEIRIKQNDDGIQASASTYVHFAVNPAVPNCRVPQAGLLPPVNLACARY